MAVRTSRCRPILVSMALAALLLACSAPARSGAPGAAPAARRAQRRRAPRRQPRAR